MNNSRNKHAPSFSRRAILFIGSLLLFYPLVRFINHRVPRKPKVIEVTGTLKQDGHLAKDEFILFSRDEKFWAVSRNCTHLGCRLNYKEKESILECPCHQSRFSISGELLRGPAKKQLATYPVEQTGTPPTYIVTIA
jgi:cytochrome b6-f complex iron-sulfur subunit